MCFGERASASSPSGIYLFLFGVCKREGGREEERWLWPEVEGLSRVLRVVSGEPIESQGGTRGSAAVMLASRTPRSRVALFYYIPLIS